MNAPLDKATITNMTSSGQVLIPKDVRDAIGLVPGGPVQVGINDRGEAVVTLGSVSAREAPGDRGSRLLAALVKAGAIHRTGRSTDEIMRELRGDEPLP